MSSRETEEKEAKANQRDDAITGVGAGEKERRNGEKRKEGEKKGVWDGSVSWLDPTPYSPTN